MVSYNKEEPETIQAMFNSIAKSYDRTNGLMSFQLHRYWNKELVNATLHNWEKIAPCRFVDLCCGTGDIAKVWLKHARTPQNCFLIDFCGEMLACAKSKISDCGLDAGHVITYLQSDVQMLPLPSESIDCMTMAYGIRNVKNPDASFNEAYRTLDKGGRLGILELTEPNGWLLKRLHHLYLKTALPLIGKLTTSNKPAYEYLSKSIGAFTKPQELAVQLHQCGFSNVEIVPLTGGIATLIIATKS
jgi:demethylmenaquinone methyltransferase/2-methoxy-6-polyprenyl-1,4-benzoquinol methylase